MIPSPIRPDLPSGERAGTAHAGPLLTPDKLANFLRVHRTRSTGGAVEVDFIPEYEGGAEGAEPSEEVAAWLEQRDFVISESGGTVLEHLIIPAEVELVEESVVAVRDCRFLVVQYPETSDEAVA